MKRVVTLPFLLLWLCTVLSACRESESPRSGSDMTGTRQERVEAFTARLARRIQPPGPVLDARWVAVSPESGRIHVYSYTT